jgi:hypothetical protein
MGEMKGREKENGAGADVTQTKNGLSIIHPLLSPKEEEIHNSSVKFSGLLLQK